MKISPVLGTHIFKLQGGSENVLLWFSESFPGNFQNFQRMEILGYLKTIKKPSETFNKTASLVWVKCFELQAQIGHMKMNLHRH